MYNGDGYVKICCNKKCRNKSIIRIRLSRVVKRDDEHFYKLKKKKKKEERKKEKIYNIRWDNLCFRCNPDKVKRSLTNKCRINITKLWTGNQLVRADISFIFFEWTKRISPSPQIFPSNGSPRSSIPNTEEFQFQIDIETTRLRISLRSRKPEAGRFRDEKKRGKERKKRERNAVVWMKSFLPDMHSYEPSGVFARNRAQALARFKRTVEGRGLWPLSCRSF